MTTCEKIYTLSQHLTKPQQIETLNFIEFLIARYDPQQGAKSRGKIKAGSARGKIKMAADFDAPLDDFAEYMS